MRKIVLLFMCLLSWSSSASAASVMPGHAVLLLESSAQANLQEEQDAWRVACPLIAQRLLVGQGAWGHGVLESFSCFTKGKITAGLQQKKMAQWRFLFVIGSPPKRVKIQFWSKKAWQTIHEMPLAVPGLAALKNPDLATLTALDITYHMPLARLVQWDQDIQTAPALKLPAQLSPPTSYQVFTVSYEDGQWFPRVVGSLELEPSPGATAPQWRLKRNSGPTPEGPYWAFDTSREDAVTQLKQTIGTAATQQEKTDSGGILNTFARGYVGMRYGISILAEDSLIKKARLFSLFTEVRGGPLAGLRWYWDSVPFVAEAHQGQEVYFAFSRPSFGWSIGWNIDFLNLTRFDVTPKFGLSDFRSKLPVKTQNGTDTVTTFTVQNAPSFGAELGLEALTPLMLLRFWGAADLSTIVSLGGAKSVSSLRGGIDSYFHVYKFANTYSLSLIGFAVMEQLNFQDNVKPDAKDTTTKVREVNLDLTFVGAGISLVW